MKTKITHLFIMLLAVFMLPSIVNGQYCTPAPSSVDNNGITNVSFSTVANTTSTETGNYGDYSAMIGDAGRTVILTVNITYYTGYDYVTKIWVDWNNDNDFEDTGEEVYSGLSGTAKPTTLSCSFTIPNTASLGNHRMRIGGADSGPPTPCYTGTYATYEDYTINVTLPPTCFSPTNQTVTDLADVSAKLNWTTGGATTFGIEYGPKDFTHGTGTYLAVTTDEFLTITGLTANTEYDWYIKDSCSTVDVSTWSGPNNFTTTTPIQTIPFNEGFEGDLSTWLITGNATPVLSQSPLVPDVGGANNLNMINNKLNANSQITAVFSPTTDPKINFTYWVDYNSTSYGNNLTVSIQEAGTSTWTVIHDYNTDYGTSSDDDVWLYVTDLDLASYDTESGTFKIKFDAKSKSSYSSYNVFLDNISLILPPTCPKPTNQLISDLEATSVQLNWTTGGATNFTVEYGITGFTQGTGTLIDVATDTFLVLNTLTPETEYDWYVQDSCDVADVSLWSNNNSFTTLVSCPAPSNMIVTSTTTTSAHLNWSSGGSSNYNIEYGITDFTQGTGTMVNVVTDTFEVITGLTAGTEYDWYVQDSCGDGDASVWTSNSFFTSFTPPYYQDFTSFSPSDWTQAKGLLLPVSTLSGTSSSWVSDGFANVGSSGAARMNIYTSNQNEWLITPSIDLGTKNCYLKFDIALTNFNSISSTTLEADDSVAVVISTDNGLTWSSANILQLWSSTTPISNTGDNIIIDLSAYSSLVKIAFYASSRIDVSADIDLSIDNIEIYEPFTNDISISQITGTYGGRTATATDIITITVTNEGTADLTGVPLKYKYDDVLVGDETIDLLAFTSATYEFTTTYDGTVGGDHTLMAYSDLATDENRTNDTSHLEFETAALGDIGVIDLISPNSSICDDAAAVVEVKVKNFGVEEQSAVPVVVVITQPNGSIVTLNGTTGTIAPLGTEIVSMGTTSTLSDGIYAIKTHTSLATDIVYNDNDTLTASFEIYPALDVDYVETFDNTTNWSTNMGSSSAHGKNGNGLYKNLYGTNPTSYATMNKKIGPISAGDSLVFDYRLLEYSYSTPYDAQTLAADSFFFMISTDCGTTYNNEYIVTSANHTATTDWTNIKLDLSSYIGQKVMLKIKAKRTAGDYFFEVDNFGIATIPTVDLAPDTTICIGVPVAIDAGGTTSGYLYSWTNNGYADIISTDQIINPDSAGTYIVVITSPLGSIVTDTIIISTNDLPTVAFTTNEICIGDDATLDAIFTGASPWDFSYAKIGVDTTEVAAVTSPWTSSFALADTSDFTIITITDANGCKSIIHSDTVTVNVNLLPIATIASLPNVCANENVFTYTQGSGAAGGSGYYSGLGVDSITSTFNAVTAGSGSHTITYTYIDSNSCANSASEIQLVNALPNITALATDNPVPYNTTTTITASIDNAVGNISYVWTPSSNITETDTTTNTLTTTTALATVNYYVKVTDDGNTCTTWDTIVLPYSGGPVSVAPSSNPTAICSGDAAILSSGTSGGSGTINYVWTSNPIGFNSTDENPSVSPTVDTWYILSATDDVLTTTDSVLVTIIADPSISYVVDTTFACIGSEANAIVNITGTAPFSYTYNGIITNATNNIDTILFIAGVDATYQLTSVTDDNGCNASADFDSIVISAWALPTVTYSGSDDICIGENATATATFTGLMPFDYIYNGIAINGVNSMSDDQIITPTTDSMFVVTKVTDANGCILMDSSEVITIIVNPLPTAIASDNDSICLGDSTMLSINFTGAAPYMFDIWNGTGMLSDIPSATDLFTIYDNSTSATTYTIKSITDANGCILNGDIDSLEIFVNSLPATPSFTGLTTDYCEDAAVVTLSGLPTGGTYTGAGITGNDFDPSAANSGTNDIEYRIADANGCENFVINSTIINELPTIIISGLASAYCIDAADITLTAIPTGTGGVWSDATTTGDFSPATSGLGNHTVVYTFTDANMCVNTDSVITMINDLPSITLTTLADVCADANSFIVADASPIGGNWSGNGVSNNYFNPVTAGTGSHYLTYTFTDANGCLSNDSTIQLVNTLPIINITGLDAAYCADANTDTISATPAGGNFFGGSMTGDVFDPSMVSSGYVSILYMYTDANGCFNSAPANTMVNAIPVIDFGSDKTVCENNSSTLDAGNTGASYLWSNGETTQTIVLDTNGLGIGDFMYNVLITDANMCTNMDSIEITYEVLPVSQLTDENSICGENAEITLDAGYVSGNTYVWSNGVSWSSITINSADLGSLNGDMSVEITSNAGCVTYDTTSVSFLEIPTVDLGGDQIVCINNEFTIDAGTGFTSYLWNTGATTQSITIDSNTFDVGQNILKVEIYNAVNCSAMDSMILVVDPCTGVQMPELSNANINIYPNPSKGQFQIDVVGLDNAEYNLDIYNSVGSVVYSDKVSNDGNNKQTWKLDFSTYAKGVYHIRLHSNGDIKVKRIIIN